MQPAKFAWYELLTPDLPAARCFYNAITGWEESPWCDDTYDVWTAQDGVVCGALAMPPGVQQSWLGYVAVDDVDAVVQRAERLRGTVVKPATDLPNMGRFAVLADPQGAAFAVSSMRGSADDTCAADRHFAWAELHTNDREAAWGFYAELFGWTAAGSFSMGPQWGTYFMFAAGGETAIGAVFDGAKVEGARPFWLHYIRVADADEAARITVRRGGRILHGPADIPVGDGRVAQLLDPQGGRFGVVAGS